MITGSDKLSDVISRNIDLLPITDRMGFNVQIGEQTIQEICILHNQDARFALGILNTYSSADYFPKSDELNLPDLLDFLRKTHEYHKHVTIPRLTGIIERLKHLMPDEKLLIVVERYLNQYIEKLIHHIDYEEEEIFPLATKKADTKGKGHVSNLKKIFKQHANVENEISDLKTIIIRHIPAYVDMNLIHDLLHTLSHFEREQFDHARFEDKILIPRLIALQAL